MLRSCGIVTALALCATAAFAQTAEHEPNNTPATANSATLGGKVTGTLMYRPGDAGDDPVDWWVLSVNAGQTIYVDVDADEFGSALDATVALYGSDGTTELARSDNWDGLDPYVAYAAPASGTYYVKIVTGPGPSTVQPYTINFTEAKCPTTADDAEPNNTVAQARTVSLGATVHGYACPFGDQDYYQVQIPAGTKVELQMDTVGRERPAFGCACGISPHLALLSSDGTTTLAETHENEYPQRVSYTTSGAGTYYIAASIWPGGIRYPYTLHVGSASAGRADPPVVRADGLGSPWGVIADQTGDLIISDEGGNQVWWVAPDGRKQVISNAVHSPSALAWDAFGNLLIVGNAGVYKLNPQGKTSSFIAGAGFRGVALGADGTLWLTSTNAPSVRHYDAFGNLIETIAVQLSADESGPYEIAVSSGGDVYYATDRINTPEGSSVYRVAGTQGQPVFQVPVNLTGLAVDAAGSFYLTTSYHNQVYRYSATGAALDDPLASQVNQPVGLAFGRNADGSMNSHLYVVQQTGQLVELNGAGISQRGAPVGFATPSQATDDLLRSGSLTAKQRQVLDQLGNKNGRYDIGDLRAFLLQTMTLSPGAPFGAGGTP